MGVMFRYELKKLFSRRLVWLLLAVCTAFVLLASGSPLEEKWSGRVQGMRDIYGKYEGRVVTDAFQKEVQRDFEEYVVTHSEQFYPPEIAEDGSMHCSAKGWGYYSGVWEAFNRIKNMRSVEAERESLRFIEETLARGRYEDGSSIPYYALEEYRSRAQTGFATPVVHYLCGWGLLYSTDSPFPGASILLLLALGLLPLFSGEGASRMVGVLLCSRNRKNAAMAKMLAAAGYAGALAILFVGIKLLVVALSYGLDGASLPISALPYGPGWGNIPFGAAFALSALATALAAMASAALIALASALFRNILPALLFAGSIVVIQVLFAGAFGGSAVWMQEFLMNPPWYYLWGYFARLPVMALVNSYVLLDGMSSGSLAAFSLAFPALLTVLLFWLAPRRFLKQRKA